MVDSAQSQSPVPTHNHTVIGVTTEGNVGIQLVDVAREETASLFLPPAEAVNMGLRLIHAAYSAQLRRVLEESPIGPEVMQNILQAMLHDLDDTLQLPTNDH